MQLDIASHVERMIVERTELEIKISALKKFIEGGSDSYMNLSGIQKHLLNEQFEAMEIYLQVLSARIGLSV